MNGVRLRSATSEAELLFQHREMREIFSRGQLTMAVCERLNVLQKYGKSLITGPWGKLLALPSVCDFVERRRVVLSPVLPHYPVVLDEASNNCYRLSFWHVIYRGPLEIVNDGSCDECGILPHASADLRNQWSTHVASINWRLKISDLPCLANCDSTASARHFTIYQASASPPNHTQRKTKSSHHGTIYIKIPP